MKYRRYGKFRFRDYSSTLFGVVFLFVLVVVGFLTDTQFYLLIWPLLLIIIMIWSIYSANRECLLILGDTITIMRGRKNKKVSIPSEPTLVVSYADVFPFAKHVSYGNNTYMLKGRYAISILEKMPLETVLARLHQNHTFKYTASTVELSFDESLYVYSFVGNQELLDKLMSNRNCQIIIPETLLNQIPIDLHQTNIYIDTGY